VQTCYRIVNFNEYLEFPDDIDISDEAKDLIINLLTDANKRLGYNSVDEIKNHAFFKGIDWDNIRQQQAPFIRKFIF
jgi:hypothetical protein